MREVAAERPNVRVIDYGDYLNERPAEDDRLRPDGIHLTWASAATVAAWLGPQIASAITHMPITAP